MKIIEIQSGKKKLELVAGLIWHPLNSSGSARSKEILSYAQSGSANLKVMRGTDSAHVGLAKKSEGAKPGQISIAAVIADALAEDGHRNVLVALLLPEERNLFVLVSVRDGVILADGDSTGELESVRNRLVGDVAYGGWDAVVCPDVWGVLNSQERQFDSFFNAEALHSPKQWSLSEISIAWRKIVVPAVLITVAVAGLNYGWEFWKTKKTAEAEVSRARQEQFEISQKSAPSEPLKPWVVMPGVQQFTQACFKAFQDVGLTAGNWALDGATCENGLFTVRWLKSSESAWLSHLMAVRPYAEVANDGMSASVTVRATAAASNDAQSALPALAGLSLRYYDLASRYGMSIRVDQPAVAQAPVALPGQSVKAEASVAAAWAAVPVQITANFDPNEVAALLSYPGLRFTKLVFAVKSGVIQYQFTGIQYVRS